MNSISQNNARKTPTVYLCGVGIKLDEASTSILEQRDNYVICGGVGGQIRKERNQANHEGDQKDEIKSDKSCR